MTEKLGVALLGAGRMGSIHGPNVVAHPDLSLAYVVDTDTNAAQALADRLGAQTSTLEKVLADPAIKGVVVASSTDMHLSHTLDALAAGKAVFCEKPLDLDLAKVRAAAGAFEGRDVRFVLGFNRRFDPHVAALKRAIDDGTVGNLETLNIINHDPAAPPPAFIPRSGGLFKDFTIHDLDLAAWLLDEAPSEIFATASCLVDPAIAAAGDVDTARVILKTASGRICTIANTRRSGYGYDQRVEAYGSKGRVATGNERNDAVEIWSEAGAHVSPIKPNFLTRYAQSYAQEIDHFAQVATGKIKSMVGYDAGVSALVWAEACAESARTNKLVKL